MQILGLTGPSGAGKGYVCRLFARYGVASVDCDAVSKRIYQPGAFCTLELANAFGADILDENGALLRRKLAQRAFADAVSTQKLNRITHPHILAEVEKELQRFAAQGARAVLLDAPTLLESGLHHRCDRLICVTAPYALRRARIIERDALSLAQADLRLNAQPADAFYRDACDFEIRNDGANDCEAQVKAILRELHLLSADAIQS